MAKMRIIRSVVFTLAGAALTYIGGRIGAESYVPVVKTREDEPVDADFEDFENVTEENKEDTED